jgi:hypothetical protein
MPRVLPIHLGMTCSLLRLPVVPQNMHGLPALGRQGGTAHYVERGTSTTAS